jgi:hypothetical protein
MLLTLKELGAHEDHGLAAHGHAPAGILGGNHHLDGPSVEESLHGPLLLLGQSLMVEGHTLGQALLEGGILDELEVLLKLLGVAAEEETLLAIGIAVGDNVKGSQLGLGWGDEN